MAIGVGVSDVHGYDAHHADARIPYERRRHRRDHLLGRERRPRVWSRREHAGEAKLSATDDARVRTQGELEVSSDAWRHSDTFGGASHRHHLIDTVLGTATMLLRRHMIRLPREAGGDGAQPARDSIDSA